MGFQLPLFRFSALGERDSDFGFLVFGVLAFHVRVADFALRGKGLSILEFSSFRDVDPNFQVFDCSLRGKRFSTLGLLVFRVLILNFRCLSVEVFGFLVLRCGGFLVFWVFGQRKDFGFSFLVFRYLGFGYWVLRLLVFEFSVKAKKKVLIFHNGSFIV